MKYEQECNAMIEAVGGRENLANAFHCMTRLRLEVKDTSKVDVAALEKVNKVLKVVQVGNQFQCVFGPQVSDVYADFCEVAGLEQQAMVDADDDAAPAEKKPRDLSPKGILDTVIEYVSGCIQPLLVGIIAAGMIKMVATLLGSQMLGLVADDSNIMTALTFAGDAPFYFLPVMVGYTAAKKFNMSPVTGMILGGILVHPTLEAIVAAGEPFDILGIPMTLVDYSSSVVPMILSCWVASYIERFLTKHIPAMFRMMGVLPLTILIMLPIMLCGLAPLGNIIGQGVAVVFQGIQQVFGPFGVGLISAVWMFLIMTGMHLPVFMSVAVTYFSQGHEDVILLAGGTATLAVTGVALGFFLRSRKPENKELGLSCFTASLLGGVAEPTIFGIMLPYPRVFLYEAIAAFVGTFISSIMGTGIYTIVGGGTAFSWMAYMGADTANLIGGLAGYFGAAITGCLLTVIFGFGEDATKWTPSFPRPQARRRPVAGLPCILASDDPGRKMDILADEGTKKMDGTEFDQLYSGECDTSWVSNQRPDVAYGEHERQRYDLYYPEGEAPEAGWPLVFFIHGGAFVKGDKRRYQMRPALTGVRRGYAVLSLQYRLASHAPLPAAFADARDALRHVVAHAAELGIDPARIVLWGESAGAELACFTGLVDHCSIVDAADAEPMPAVRGVVDWYAPLDVLAWQREIKASGQFQAPDGSTLLETIFDARGEDFLMRAALLDPQNYLRPGICPVLIEHGTADPLVDPRGSEAFRENLLLYLPEEDVPFRLVEGGVHGIADYENEENLDWVFSFIDRVTA